MRRQPGRCGCIGPDSLAIASSDRLPAKPCTKYLDCSRGITPNGIRGHLKARVDAMISPPATLRHRLVRDLSVKCPPEEPCSPLATPLVGQHGNSFSYDQADRSWNGLKRRVVAKVGSGWRIAFAASWFLGVGFINPIIGKCLASASAPYQAGRLTGFEGIRQPSARAKPEQQSPPKELATNAIQLDPGKICHVATCSVSMPRLQPSIRPCTDSYNSAHGANSSVSKRPIWLVEVSFELAANNPAHDDASQTVGVTSSSAKGPKTDWRN